MRVAVTTSPRYKRAWATVKWMLFAVWITDAVLVMWHRRAGFFTDYAADLTLPAWLYVVRRSAPHSPRIAWMRGVVNARPFVVAAVLFAASAATEVFQYFWPHGLFRGTFDPLDIVAYGVGLALCGFADQRWPIPVRAAPPAA